MGKGHNAPGSGTIGFPRGNGLSTTLHTRPVSDPRIFSPKGEVPHKLLVVEHSRLH
jgi:hypothetical protein